MAENSLIGWTDHTMNFWWGCHKVSEECRHCYIDGIMRRAGREPFRGPMRTSPSLWRNPEKWNRRAEELGIRYRIFTCSMSDFFHTGADHWRNEAWDIIRRCQNLDWQILTKRPQRIARHLPKDWGNGWPNVWLGTTCGIQRSIRRVAALCDVPARIRFVSAEPLLGPVDLKPYLDRLQWVITGCESAHHLKGTPMDMEWVRDIDRQCRDTGTAHYLKQYYRGNQLIYDGKLDGRIRQDHPLTTTAA